MQNAHPAEGAGHGRQGGLQGGRPGPCWGRKLAHRLEKTRPSTQEAPLGGVEAAAGGFEAAAGGAEAAAAHQLIN